MTSETKLWKCPNGHVLGVVVRDEVRNSQGKIGHVKRLLLFRHAIDYGQEIPTDVDVIGRPWGAMDEITCDVPGCGAVRSWVMGGDAVEYLIGALASKDDG